MAITGNRPAEATDHNREIALAAKRVLAPLGCVRKGRSRTWLDDHGWWTGVIEFQPSGWSKGSYLNVAACYLWQPAHPGPFLSFNTLFGPRPWRDATGGESFADKATELAMTARESLTEMREQCRSVAAVVDLLRSKWVEKRLWPDYDLGMALGIAGQGELARHHLLLAAETDSTNDWVNAFNRECVSYAELAGNQLAFCEMVLARIQATRTALKLPVLESEVLRRDLLDEPVRK
jgi:hypothetical protein